ncbi:ComEA family DNA-binding protein [Geobacter argillaceus]|uniref:Competence protein ComEA n=1 Tax=Geobacter argillaceus TaxID=345631 RepID=A0A562V818_9BACT|nr:helix-hairpin-helix domain-containing protein [Geobacter argillaceus]TWJ13887.1 competence protein ComEA [Geobacter argillaceus]
MERPVRLAILLLILLLYVPLVRQGRGVSPQREPAAFFHYSSGLAVIRVVGPGIQDRIYRIHDGATVEAVINMTIGPGNRAGWPKEALHRRLESGDILKIVRKENQHTDINVKKMGARERMVLGILLDPDRMNQADWDSLPGIGPKLAERIVHDRQLNGDFGSLEGVKRVSGIGDGKISMINKFFLYK